MHIGNYLLAALHFHIHVNVLMPHVNKKQQCTHPPITTEANTSLKMNTKFSNCVSHISN